jgi:hypothetical protein
MKLFVKPKNLSFSQKTTAVSFSKLFQVNKVRFYTSETNHLLSQGFTHIDQGDVKALKATVAQLPKNFNIYPLLARAEEKQQLEIIKFLLRLGQQPVSVNQKSAEERMAEQSEKKFTVSN